jgi:hypothetical protein
MALQEEIDSVARLKIKSINSNGLMDIVFEKPVLLKNNSSEDEPSLSSMFSIELLSDEIEGSNLNFSEIVSKSSTEMQIQLTFKDNNMISMGSSYDLIMVVPVLPSPFDPPLHSSPLYKSIPP